MEENRQHNHSHDHFPEMNLVSKTEQALRKYDLNVDDVAVQAAVRDIIANKVPQNDTPEIKRFLMGSIELTTLKTTDSMESVLAFTEKVNQFEAAYPDLPHVATICVYPCFASVVRASKWKALRLHVCPVLSPLHRHLSK